MAISNVRAISVYQYKPKITSDLQEKFKNTPDSEKRIYVSSKEKFVSSFAKVVDSFKKYFAGDEVQIFMGTNKEQSQLDEIVKRFQSFLEA